MSGRPAICKDSARLAASAEFLNGCLVMKCAIEKSGFMTSMRSETSARALPPSAADGATVRPINEVLKPARIKVVTGKCS